MGNYSYLCNTNLERIYPSTVDDDYDPTEQTIACDVDAVPLLWMALFRPRDMRRGEVSADDGSRIELTAPLVERSQALENLREAMPYLKELFAEERLTDDYGAFIEAALSKVSAAYLTIELYEVAVLNDEAEFYADFRAALQHLEERRAGSADALEIFARLSDLRLGQPFPPARAFLEDIKLTDDELWNHARLLGDSLYRPVPWTPA